MSAPHQLKRVRRPKVQLHTELQDRGAIVKTPVVLDCLLLAESAALVQNVALPLDNKHIRFHMPEVVSHVEQCGLVQAISDVTAVANNDTSPQICLLVTQTPLSSSVTEQLQSLADKQVITILSFTHSDDLNAWLNECDRLLHEHGWLAGIDVPRGEVIMPTCVQSQLNERLDISYVPVIQSRPYSNLPSFLQQDAVKEPFALTAHLNCWLAQYILLDDFVPDQVRAVYPLSSGQVNIERVEGTECEGFSLQLAVGLAMGFTPPIGIRLNWDNSNIEEPVKGPRYRLYI